MEFHLVRGMAIDDVVASFARLDSEDETDVEAAGDDEQDSGADDPAATPPTVTELGCRVCKLRPSTAVRSRGANQLGRRVFAGASTPSATNRCIS